MHGRFRRRVLVAVVLVVLFATTAGALYKWHHYNWAKDRMCASKLRCLGWLLTTYLSEEGKCPDDIRTVFRLCGDPFVFICPRSGRAVRLRFPEGVEPRSPEGQGIEDSFGPEHTDYAYVGGLAPTKGKHENWPPHIGDWVLLFEKEANHGGKHHVLLLTENVVLMTEAELKERLERTLREARAAGFNAMISGYAPELRGFGGHNTQWRFRGHNTPIALDRAGRGR